jgi:hypothetical protein
MSFEEKLTAWIEKEVPEIRVDRVIVGLATAGQATITIKVIAR